jgi:biotin synthase
MNAREIRGWLRETDGRRLEELWAAANECRRRNVGDAVHLRALVEISSHCVRHCLYCGLRAPRASLPRYRMPEEEVLACAARAGQLGYGTVVLQAGEDPGWTQEAVAGLVRRIRAAKESSELAITLSLGERSEEELAAWKAAGADRYLLRFETSDAALFERVHPPLPGMGGGRVKILRSLRRLGYEVGSGVMVGLPGQTRETLARDIECFAELDLDMIGVGPFIPHPDTPLGQARPPAETKTPADQVPATEEMTYKALALSRLVCPRANIPSTTALATVNRATGREKGLMRGANVVMPNVTPAKYRRLYEIYPDKACVAETPDNCGDCLAERLRAIGRTIGAGRGDAGTKPARCQSRPIAMGRL